MGYCIEMRGSKFFVPTQHTGRVFAMTQRQPYDFKLDTDGNITELTFIGEKLGNDFEMFQLIAPYVQDSSYIWMMGEDGSQWRWVFQSGVCKEITAKVEWPDE